MLDSDQLHIVGAPEVTSIDEKVVVAPCDGKFRPLPPEVFTSEGEWVRAGQALAEIDIGGSAVPVISAFEGWVMGMLAMPGQPVHERQALFWIWP